jgi:hypothetical protein
VAGEIFLKERAILTLQDNTSALLANAALVLAATATLDVRSGGNVGQDFWANFELLTGFAVAPAVDVVAAELYLVPSLDGTNWAEADTAKLQANTFVGTFVVLKAATAAQRLVLLNVPLQPLLYRVYIINRSAQSMAAGWTLRVVTAREQYS